MSNRVQSLFHFDHFVHYLSTFQIQAVPVDQPNKTFMATFLIYAKPIFAVKVVQDIAKAYVNHLSMFITPQYLFVTCIKCELVKSGNPSSSSSPASRNEVSKTVVVYFRNMSCEHCRATTMLCGTAAWVVKVVWWATSLKRDRGGEVPINPVISL